MPRIRKRPSHIHENSEDFIEAQCPSQRRRPASPSDDSSDNNDDNNDDNDDNDEEEEEENLELDSSDIMKERHAQMVGNLIRLALACEYARIPIRRADISSKVLDNQGRQLKIVFQDAQQQLRDKFGMEMVELPVKERITLRDRRSAAQKSDGHATSSNLWTLRTILPEEYRNNHNIILPPKVPSQSQEEIYVALYSFVIAIITLCEGTIPEGRLERYLKKANVDEFTPLDKTEKLIAKMCREGYLSKSRDASNGEEIIQYSIGPRGKVEVGKQGVAGLIRKVYGQVGKEAEELEKRINRSLGTKSQPATANSDDENAANVDRANRSASTSRRTRRRNRKAAAGN